jgi:hypothetical protein
MILSIFVPYYKLSYFKETLDSLALQTDKRFKVYIGNDDSPENPLPLLNAFKGQFDFLYYKFDKNLGSVSLVKQWERCIDLCDNVSSWIMILGDDDVLGPYVVSEFYNNIERINDLKINVIKYSTIVVNENDNYISKVYKTDEIINSSDAFYNKIIDTSRSSLSEHIFRKSTYQEIGFKEYGMGWHSDDMALLEFSNFKNLFCINTEKVYIRVSDKSISGNNGYSIKKEQASLKFYSDLVNKHLFKFRLNQRNLILRIYESKTISVKGKSILNYFQIFWLYAINGYFMSIFRFTIRFIFLKQKD